jgi:catechol 2,3-dioxygenase-like lactoylglutathione lyase family enzyme
MISHTHLGVSDLPRAMRFYGALMDALGYVQKFHEPENGWAGWMKPGQDRPLFLVGVPYDGGPPSPGNGSMVALLAADRDAVDRAHAVALQHGGTDEGAPGLRPHYHPDYYGAYVRDPDGNKVGLCCHEPGARLTSP